MPLTNAEVDAAMPVAGIPSRTLVNAALKELIVDVAAAAETGGDGGTNTWGDITGTLSAQSDLQTALNAKAASSHTHTSTELSNSTAVGRSMLTASDAAAQTALLNEVTTALKGLAPASGGGTDNFLRADGTWSIPPGAGGVSWGGVAGTLANQTDLQAALDLKANILAPVTLSSNTSLTAATHGNRTLLVDTAGLTLTINNDATGGWTTDDSLDVQAVGSGTFTLVQGTATLTTDSGGSADSTTAISKRVQAQRTGTSAWRTVSPAVVSPGTGNTRTFADATTYTVVDDTANNTVTTLNLGALTAGTSIDVMMHVDATSGAASNGTFAFDINGTQVTIVAMPEGSTHTGRLYKFTINIKTLTTVIASWPLLLDNSNATDAFTTTTVSSVVSSCALRLRSVRTSTGKVTRVQMLNALVKMP
jgi:hypothetical protein